MSIRENCFKLLQMFRYLKNYNFSIVENLFIGNLLNLKKSPRFAICVCKSCEFLSIVQI